MKRDMLTAAGLVVFFFATSGMLFGRCGGSGGSGPSVQLGTDLPKYTASGLPALTPEAFQAACTEIKESVEPMIVSLSASGLITPERASTLSTELQVFNNCGAPDDSQGLCNDGPFGVPDAECPAGPSPQDTWALGTVTVTEVVPAAAPVPSPASGSKASLDVVNGTDSVVIDTVSAERLETIYAAEGTDDSSGVNTLVVERKDIIAGTTASGARQGFRVGSISGSAIVAGAEAWMKAKVNAVAVAAMPNSPVVCDTSNTSNTIGVYFQKSLRNAYNGIFSTIVPDPTTTAWTSFGRVYIDKVMTQVVTLKDGQKKLSLTTFATLMNHVPPNPSTMYSQVQSICSGSSSAIAAASSTTTANFIPPQQANWNYRLGIVLRTFVEVPTTVSQISSSAPLSYINEGLANAAADLQTTISKFLQEGSGSNYQYSLQFTWVPNEVLASMTLHPLALDSLSRDLGVCARQAGKFEADYSLVVPNISDLTKVIINGEPTGKLKTAVKFDVDGPMHCYQEISTNADTTCAQVNMDSEGMTCNTPLGPVTINKHSTPGIKVTSSVNPETPIALPNSGMALKAFQSYDPAGDLVQIGNGTKHPNILNVSLTAKPERPVDVFVDNLGDFVAAGGQIMEDSTGACSEANIYGVSPFRASPGVQGVNLSTGTILTFTPANWDQPQKLYLRYYGCGNNITRPELLLNTGESAIYSKLRFTFQSCDARYDTNSVMASSCGSSYVNALYGETPPSGTQPQLIDISPPLVNSMLYVGLDPNPEYFFIDKAPLLDWRGVPTITVNSGQTANVDWFGGMGGIGGARIRGPKALRYQFVHESVINDIFRSFEASEYSSGRAAGFYMTRIPLDSDGFQTLAAFWLTGQYSFYGLPMISNSPLPDIQSRLSYENSSITSPGSKYFTIAFKSGSVFAPPPKVSFRAPYIHKRSLVPDADHKGSCNIGSGLMMIGGGGIAFYLPEMLPWGFSGTIGDYENFRLPTGKGFAQLAILGGGYLLKGAIAYAMSSTPAGAAAQAALSAAGKAVIGVAVSFLVDLLFNFIRSKISGSGDSVDSVPQNADTGTPSEEVAAANGSNTLGKAVTKIAVNEGAQKVAKLALKIPSDGLNFTQTVSKAIAEKVANAPMVIAQLLVTLITDALIDLMVQFLQVVSVGGQDRTTYLGSCVDDWQCPCVLMRTM